MYLLVKDLCICIFTCTQNQSVGVWHGPKLTTFWSRSLNFSLDNSHEDDQEDQGVQYQLHQDDPDPHLAMSR